jgi:PadR family transcriptional regulator AphA
VERRCKRVPKTNRTKYAILGMLTIKPMSGYEMKKRFDGSIAHFWNENYGHIYPVLKRLELEGLVTKKTEQASGNPPRNIYSVTDRGRRELHDWLLLPAERPTLRIELLLKLFFGYGIPVENAMEKVRMEKAACEQALHTFEQIEEHLLSVDHGEGAKVTPYALITLRYGQHYYRAIADWCDETLSTLEKRTSSPEARDEERK